MEAAHAATTSTTTDATDRRNSNCGLLLPIVFRVLHAQLRLIEGEWIANSGSDNASSAKAWTMHQRWQDAAAII